MHHWMLSLHRPRVRPILLNERGTAIGHFGELDTSSGNSLSTAGEVWSTCLHFNGNYIDSRGRQRVIQVGRKYKLRAQLIGILPAADALLGRDPVLSEVREAPASCVVTPPWYKHG